jgi:hypothetical protein
MKRISRTLGALGVSAGLLLGGTAAALASPAPQAPYDYYTPTISGVSGTVYQGSAISLWLSGFLPGESIEIGVFSDYQKLTEWTANQAGRVLNSPLTLPADLSVGRHTIQAKGLTSGRTAQVEINVVKREIAFDDPPASTPGQTPVKKATSGQPASAGDVPVSEAGLAGPLGLASVLLLAGGVLAVRRATAS